MLFWWCASAIISWKRKKINELVYLSANQCYKSLVKKKNTYIRVAFDSFVHCRCDCFITYVDLLDGLWRERE